ncbi:MAG TPA: hypothetical protein VN376_04355 [Longilinea sp.]|nr:hypothetical protein [Longilinea sp.]
MKIRILFSILLICLTGCAVVPADPVEPSVTPTETIGPTPTRTTTPDPQERYEAQVTLFDYDASIPLDPVYGTEYPEPNVTVVAVSYQGTENCQAEALLVMPEGEGPYPAVIYLHRVPAVKTQFLTEAIDLAGQGIVSLLLGSPFDTGCYTMNARDGQGYIDTVIFIRRGIDFLESLPQVDPSRIAYVGHSFGANSGGVVAGVDDRIHFFVLMAGVADIALYNGSYLNDLNADQYISHADDDIFLFQFATDDEYILHSAANYYYDVASGEKTILWYDTDHAGVQDLGEADRVAWLLEQLGVSGE